MEKREVVLANATGGPPLDPHTHLLEQPLPPFRILQAVPRRSTGFGEEIAQIGETGFHPSCRCLPGPSDLHPGINGMQSAARPLTECGEDIRFHFFGESM